MRFGLRGGFLVRVMAAGSLMVCLGLSAQGDEVSSGRGEMEARAVQTARAPSARAGTWYESASSLERVSWGGIAACALLGGFHLVGRWWGLRWRGVIPDGFESRFQRRLEAGELDAGKALDYCELNPSSASRVALGAVRRWERSVADQERAVSMAVRVEGARLRKNLGTLRRVGTIAPLLGLLGTLGKLEQGLSLSVGAVAWSSVVAGSLGTLTAGVALAILAFVAFDGLTERAEGLVERLERIGSETVDAISSHDGKGGGSRVPRPHHRVGAIGGREASGVRVDRQGLREE